MRDCELDAAPGLGLPRHALRITHYASRLARFISPGRFTNAWPVISRELRAEARNPLNYWFRLLGAGVVVAGFALMMIDQSGRAGQLGARLFRELNSMLFFSIAVFVPMLTADCLSREKREGTLGLPFLTPLKARDIVIGKSLLHTVRALTLLLAALPVLLLPFMLGGVSGRQVTQAIAFNLSALLLALAAGLLASVRNTEWVRAVVVAEILSGTLILLWSFLNGFLVSATALIGNIFRHLQWTASAELVQMFGQALAFVLSKLPIGIGLLAAVVMFGWMIRRAVAHLNRIWQEESAAAPQPGWVKFFSSSDFWRAFFRWDKSRTLDRNPIAWLQEYSWTARLTKWGWFGVIMIGELLMLFNYAFFFLWQLRLALVLALGMAFTSAWSFRRERQSGALELLLVTPLQAGQLIRGRLWGLWAHFFQPLRS
ncbi:MAG: hypothetical protein FJ403_05095 [Verrucomicrobia bacterium]|nr:hypothetical protein [Verrucomicrobiota bacterium]